MSTLKVNTLTDTAATKSVPIEDVVNGTARAWVNFNGTGTVAIRAQYNVSSIIDNGTADYTVNFTTAMPDANYSVAGSGTAAPGSSYYSYMCVHTRAVGSVRTQTVYGHAYIVDSAECGVTIFR